MSQLTEDDIVDILRGIDSVDDIKTGRLPGYFFEKVIELGHLIMEPFSPENVGNNCYYMRFGNKFREPRALDEPIDLSDAKSIENSFEPYKEMEKYTLMPLKSVIAQTYELVGVSSWFIMELENTSNLARALINHASHGFLHSGHGIKKPIQLMIEATNFHKTPVDIVPGETRAFRVYLEKLPYPAGGYVSISGPKLHMDSSDRS